MYVRIRIRNAAYGCMYHYGVLGMTPLVVPVVQMLLEYRIIEEYLDPYKQGFFHPKPQALGLGP